MSLNILKLIETNIETNRNTGRCKRNSTKRSNRMAQFGHDRLECVQGTTIMKYENVTINFVKCVH